MAAWEDGPFAFAYRDRNAAPYSTRRSAAIIATLSLGFWSLLGLVIYEIF